MDALELSLSKYNYLQECILLEFKVSMYQTRLEMVFNYVWTEGGKIRPNINVQEKVSLVFQLVQEIHINNVLNDSMLLHPLEMNWGMNEIALVKIEDNEIVLKPYSHSATPMRHIAVLWEDARRIDVVFANLQIKKI